MNKAYEDFLAKSIVEYTGRYNWMFLDCSTMLPQVVELLYKDLFPNQRLDLIKDLFE